MASTTVGLWEVKDRKPKQVNMQIRPRKNLGLTLILQWFLSFDASRIHISYNKSRKSDFFCLETGILWLVFKMT